MSKRRWQCGRLMLAAALAAVVSMIVPAVPASAAPQRITWADAERNQDGRLELFVADTDGVIWNRWQLDPNGPAWSGWHQMSSPGNYRVVASGRNADGRLEVFATVDEGNVVRHAYQTTANGPAWTGGLAFGTGHTVWAGQRNQDGRLEVFADAATHRWQLAPNSGWSGWYDFGAANLIYTFIGAGAAARNQDGRLEVFASRNSRLRGITAWHRWQQAANSGWVSDWYDFSSGCNCQILAATTNANGRIEVFALNGVFDLVHRWQLAPNSGWSDWSRM
jgi:hypothetical protein